MRMSRFGWPDCLVKDSVDRCLQCDSIRSSKIDDSNTFACP